MLDAERGCGAEDFGEEFREAECEQGVADGCSGEFGVGGRVESFRQVVEADAEASIPTSPSAIVRYVAVGAVLRVEPAQLLAPPFGLTSCRITSYT